MRDTVGPSYLRYLEAPIDCIAFAGQLFDDSDVDPTARLYFLTAGTADEAWQTMEASPYFLGGLYSDCSVNLFSGVIGQIIGGVA